MASDSGQDPAKKAHSGIPQAPFVEDVDAFMSLDENVEQAEKVIRRFNEQHQKYRFMEHNMSTKKKRLKEQIPDIRTTLEIVRQLVKKKESKEGTVAQFLLSDQLYAKAKIPATDKVCLWLGANVMLEYSLADAEALLEKNLGQAEASLVQLDDDLGFLRDQITTVEVNMARVYNWDVKRRQQLKAAS